MSAMNLRLHAHIERGGRFIRHMKSGSAERASAITTRWRMPPKTHADSRRCAFPGGDAHLGEKFDGAIARGTRRKIRMRADRLDELLAHAIERVQRGQRVLEDHGDLPPADATHLLRRQVVDALAVEQDFPARDAARRLDQPDDRRTRDALACAAFAHNAQHFAARNIEGNAINRARSRVAWRIPRAGFGQK